MNNEPPRRRRSSMEWLLVVVAVAVGIPAAMWLAQERLIFFPQPIVAASRMPHGTAPVEVVAADGVRLRGWIVRGSASPAPVVIYFGGNAEEVSWTLGDRRWPQAWTIVGINYRGYGESEGKPGERELMSDALAIYDAVARREDIDPNRIVAFGRSLGSAVATHLAAGRPVAAVVLVSPFDSLTAIGRRHYPWLPVSLLLRHPFDTVADAARIHVPLLAIVAETDEIIPPERSRAQFDAWAGPKIRRTVQNVDHNTLGASPEFWEFVGSFLARAGSGP